MGQPGVADEETAAAVTSWCKRVETSCHGLVDIEFVSKGEQCVRYGPKVRGWVAIPA